MQLNGRYTQGTTLFHAGGYQGYTDGIFQGWINDRTKGYIGRVFNGLPDSFGNLVDFKEGHIVATTNIEEHAAGTTNTHIEKTTGNGFFCRTPGTIAPLPLPDAHQSCSRVMEDTAYISEVHVNHARYIDDLGDALNTLAQYVIGQLKGLSQATIASRSCQQAIVGNGDQGVNL
jgi:hypothetical protein